MAGGRPTDYNEAMATEILRRLAEGETVSEICRDEDMPNKSSVFLWSSIHKEFSDRYLVALKGVGQIKVDKIPEVIEDMKKGLTDPAIGKLEIDALKWMAGKFYPRMYGDKQIVESKNENVNVNVDLPITDADREILKRIGYVGD